MAAELYKPFVIRKLIERGIVKTVKSAKKIIDKKEPVVWDILRKRSQRTSSITKSCAYITPFGYTSISTKIN